MASTPTLSTLALLGLVALLAAAALGAPSREAVLVSEGGAAPDHHDQAPASSNEEQQPEKAAPEAKGEDDQQPEEAAPEEQQPEGGADSSNDQCKDACIPSIDSKASVMQSYKRHRAQAALIGDYGSCKPSSKNTYTWEIEWGDEEEHVKKLHHVGPFHAEHTYSKKGKYQLDARFCAHLDGCDSGCTTISKKLKVKP